jgi:hypothetical protein
MALCKSWDGMGVYRLGGQDTIPKRSIQIGDREVNRWYFYDETRGSERQCAQGKALAEVAPRPNMRAEYASLLRPDGDI